MRSTLFIFIFFVDLVFGSIHADIYASASMGNGRYLSADMNAVPTGSPSCNDTTTTLNWDPWAMLVIDGMPAGQLFNYNVSGTPIVTSVSPFDISAAVTTRITILGEKFLSGGDGNSTVVWIGDDRCAVKVIEDDRIECVLTRQFNVELSSQEVRVDVRGVGFAGYAQSEHLTGLPRILRGFEVFNVDPSSGSLMGGATLVINGYGFLPDAPERHTVTLYRNDIVKSEYDQLKEDLGLVAPTDTIECTVLDVTFTQLICDLVHEHIHKHGALGLSLHEEMVNNPDNGSFDIIVTLNGIEAVSEGGPLQYFQHIDSTPIIDSASLISENTTTGELFVVLHGNDVLVQHADQLQVFFGGMHGIEAVNVQLIDGAVYTTIPALTSGRWSIEAHVKQSGHACSSAYLFTNISISSAHAESLTGSLGGGTVMHLHGYGFNLECAINVVALDLSDGSRVVVDEKDFLSCSVYHLSFYSPSVTDLYVSTSISVAHITAASFAKNSSTDTAFIDFTYEAASTPFVISGGSVTGAAGTVSSLHIEISQVVSFHASVISVGRVNCTEESHAFLSQGLSFSELVWNCVTPGLSGPIRYDVRAVLRPFGNAILSSTLELPTYFSVFEVNAYNGAPNSSVAGGTTLHISGYGFSNLTVVTVCGVVCEVPGAIETHDESGHAHRALALDYADAITYDVYHCISPARQTLSSVEHFSAVLSNDFDVYETLNGELYGSNPSSTIIDRAYDQNFLTYYSDTRYHCFVGLKLPLDTYAQPLRLRYYPRLQHSDDLGKAVFEGSSDGGATYEILGSIQNSHEGWNFVNADKDKTTKWYNAFRFRSTERELGYSCSLAEFSVIGILANTKDICPVEIASSKDASKTRIGEIAYVASRSPYVSRVDPSSGTALGGTVVTIFGDRFDDSAQLSDIKVLLHEIPCFITNITKTRIICVSGERPPDAITDGKLEVYFPTRGNAIVGDSAVFKYIDKWSELTSWRNQEPPLAGDLVWIPRGQVILLDVDTPVLLMLVIEGELYFDETKDHISLESNYIYVFGGVLEIGTEEKPYLSKATITLHGDRFTSIEIPNIGSKVLCVTPRSASHHGHDSHGEMKTNMHDGEHIALGNLGRLDIHGEKRMRTWTKLNETAPAGIDYLVTVEPVDFKAGEKIVIPGTRVAAAGEGKNPDDYEVEVVTVVSNTDYHTVYFEPPLRFTHLSEMPTVEGRTIDLRCAVGLLTRNLKIQGDGNSEKQLFGVHTMTMGAPYRIENVEITNCGQAFNVGRYCTHTHHSGAFEGNYVKANSIHRSFQRAVTTHDTLHWEVRDNVAYDITGHAYFVEDGSELYNTLSGNLGILIKPSSALLNSDHKPAVFWTANPQNYWYGNYAAHGFQFGYWFELIGGVTTVGNSKECPVNGHLGEFRNNTAHGCRSFGLRIYPKWTPHADPCDPSSPKAPQYLRDMVSFRNGQGMFGKKHGQLHHIGYSFVENAGTDVDIFMYLADYTNDPTFLNTMIIARLPDHTETVKAGGFGVFAPQDEYFYMKNLTAINYGTVPVLTGCNGCNSGEFMRQGAFTYRWEGLKFVNSPRRTSWSPHYKQIFWDLDGSLGGTPDS